MQQPYKLYGRPGSGSVVVQIALEDIGAPYERIWVGRGAAEVAEFRVLSPTGTVPALGLPDGSVMFESAAILIHLALAHPEAAIAPPPGTAAHAQFLQWMVFLSANLYAAALRVYYADRYSTLGPAGVDPIRDRATKEYAEHLELISARLDPYIFGKDYSIADAYLHMLASWFPGDQRELHCRLPRLGAHAERLSLRPSVVKTTADHAL